MFFFLTLDLKRKQTKYFKILNFILLFCGKLPVISINLKLKGKSILCRVSISNKGKNGAWSSFPEKLFPH